MPAIIDSIIPQQNFEKVRDQIAVILLLELTKQKQLQGVLFPEPVNVFLERITPIDIQELVYVNVLLDSATYGGFTPKDSQGRTVFFIDIYTIGEAGDDISGSIDSTFRLHKFIGMVRYILSSTLYSTLGFPPGFIGGKYVESFATLDPSQKQDSNFSRMARIQFAVRIQENQDMWDGVPLMISNTTVKLELTNKGYKYVFEN